EADFENRIKVPYQKMLELLITLLQDGIISPREQILIDNFAQEWGVNKETVSGMIEMILKSREIGYEIIRRVHKGSIGEDAFLAQDKKMNKFIVEFVPNITFDKKEIVPPDISHPSLLVSKEIIKYEDGVLIVNEFFEGKTLREVNEEARETHTRKVLNVALQVAEGLEELHRNGLIHSYLRPESIIVTDESEIRLSALDANKLRITEPADTGKYLNTVSYFSPEQIKNQPLDQRSDIFSYGILIYELLTGERPFEGKNKGELKEAICYKDISFEESLKPAMTNDIRVVLEKCLQKNPDERYQNIKELINDLRNLFSKPGLEIDEKRTGKEEKDIKKFTAKPIPFLKRKKVLIPAVFVSLVALALIVFKVFMSTSYRIVPNTIVVNHFIDDRTPEQVNKFSSDMVEYLVIDDLLQSSKEQVFVFSEEDFDFIYGKENRIPELRITGDISLKNVAYEINCVLIKDGSANKKIPISFADPSALLKGYISNFTKKILTEMNKPGIKASAFTDRWEAFEKFYLGEKAWKKLEVTKAEQLFRSSLVYDQTFILAKLRLAQVLLFLGINLEAHELIHEIEAHKHKLSRFDSLRVEAVNARLGGDLFKEISILQDIYNGFPSRKEFTLDVAEAFYEICEIDKAIYYYKKSLLLDKNFAKAHNHMAYCFSHQGKHELALSHFRKYVQLDSTANAYDSMGDGYMTAGKLDSAEWAKKQGTLLNPELSYLWGSWGFINIRQGKLKQADENFQKYFDLSQGENRKAVALYRKALTHYFRKDYSASLDQCLQAQALFDTTNIVTRNHDLHWLMGILHLKLNQDEKAKQELTRMEEIVKKHGINATNYRRGIYKYLIHLRACIAAKNNDVTTFKKCLEEFDGPIKNKIKDHGSPFDLAFFNTSFAALIMEYKILPIEHGEKRLRIALDYNPNYALGFYNLGRYFNKAGDNNSANTQIRKFKELWKDADKNVKMIYGL
ncbi:protein kinase, partial [candidate division KSB1 bacterium]|nr:protein kinase [candidate division KSB1 bacterium]